PRAAAGRERDVHREPAALPLAYVLRGARPGIDPALVRREIEHVCAIREDVPRAVAVVRVVVHDGDPLALGDLRRGGDGDVVQVAKAPAVVRTRVVARRPDDRNRRPTVPPGTPRGVTHGAR